MDLVGKRFGRLTVLSRAEPRIYPNGYKHHKWNCVCECGKKTTPFQCTLIAGRAKSCGCYNREKTRVHGLSHLKAYSSWGNMMERCYNISNNRYYRYGARGIKVCKRWHDLENFFKDMGEPPHGYSLDRIDNDRNYMPSNCRWANKKEQSWNTSRSRLVEGTDECLSEYCQKRNLNYKRVWGRLKAGLSFEEAINKKRRKSGIAKKSE